MAETRTESQTKNEHYMINIMRLIARGVAAVCVWQVYAVGIMLTQMLTKQQPWPADVSTAKLIRMRAVSEVVAPAPLCALAAAPGLSGASGFLM